MSRFARLVAASAPATAARELFAPLEKSTSWRELAALFDLITAIVGERDPIALGGPLLESIGDGWWLCPLCADAFEASGGESTCPKCGGTLGGSSRLLRVDLDGGGHMWLSPPGDETLEAFSSMRVERDGTWFVFHDADGKAALSRRRIETVPLFTFRYSIVGEDSDGAVWVTETKAFRPWVLAAGATTPVRAEHDGTLEDFIITTMRETLAPGRTLGPSTEASDAARRLAALTLETCWKEFPLSTTQPGLYQSNDRLVALLNVGDIPAASLLPLGRILLESFTFLPGSGFCPAWLEGKRRIDGSPLPLLEPLLLAMKRSDRAVYERYAAEALRYVLADADVIDHDPDGRQPNLARALLTDLERISPLDEETRAILVASLSRAAKSASGWEYLDLFPLALHLLSSGSTSDQQATIVEALRSWATLDDGDDSEDLLPRYVESQLMSAATLAGYAAALERIPDLVKHEPLRLLLGRMRAATG